MGHRLTGWHREADATVMFILSFTPFHPTALSLPLAPSFFSTTTTFFSSYLLFLLFRFQFFFSLPTSLFILYDAVHYVVEIQKKEVFLLCLFPPSPSSTPSSSSLDPALTVLVHEIMFCFAKWFSLLIIKRITTTIFIIIVTAIFNIIIIITIVNIYLQLFVYGSLFFGLAFIFIAISLTYSKL